MEIKYCLLVIALLFFSCNKKETRVQYSAIQFVKEVSLVVSEPSGLAYVNSDKNSFYTVSDNTSMIYKLSWTGALIGTLDYKGDDLEGITVDSETGDIYIVEERLRDVVKLNSKGVEVKRFHLDIEENNENSGLEGIAFNSDNRHLYILNEKDPGLLIEINENGKVLNRTELDFAFDYSGIYYENIEKKLWIVSDQSRTISKCDLNGEKIESYKISDRKAEGITVDAVNKKVYIVLDGQDKLQVYSFK